MTPSDAAVSSSSTEPERDAQGRRIWRVGTITYTRGSLSNVFVWMLWGDFCLTLMDFGVVPNLVPLQMKKHGASGMMIGFVTGTVMELMSTVMVAIVSTWSDRHRGRLGRRMPFLLWATPPLALCLVLLGYSPKLAAWLAEIAPGAVAGINLGALTIGTMTVALTAYKFFDIVPQSVYYYLFPDVIPAKLMGTFTALFRVVGALGTMLFNWKLITYVETHPEWICLFAAGLYLFAFLMLVLMVREGDYPPPEPPPAGALPERTAKTVYAPSSETSGDDQFTIRGPSVALGTADHSLPANGAASAQTCLFSLTSRIASLRTDSTSPTFVRPGIISGYEDCVM